MTKDTISEVQSTMTEEKDNKPWPLYIIFGMVTLVLISGYLFSPKTEEEKLRWVTLLGTTNNGTLLNPPIEVAAAQIVDLDGNPWAGVEDNTWKMFVLSPKVCEQTCIDRLVELHAMRIRLHRDADRLSIGLLSSDAQNLPAEIAEFHDLQQVLLGDDTLLASLKQTNIPSFDQDPVVLLMNPIDVIMMAYGMDKIGSEILADFEHLLDLAH